MTRSWRAPTVTTSPLRYGPEATGSFTVIRCTVTVELEYGSDLDQATAALQTAQRARMAEIEAVRWIDPALGIDDAAEAPLNRELVFPMLLAERAVEL